MQNTHIIVIYIKNSLRMPIFAFRTRKQVGCTCNRQSPLPTVRNKMNDTTTVEADLLYEIRDGIGRITINRPQARNSLTFGMYERLADICENAGKDRALKVLILTGAGDKAF